METFTFTFTSIKHGRIDNEIRETKWVSFMINSLYNKFRFLKTWSRKTMVRNTNE